LGDSPLSGDISLSPTKGEGPLVSASSLTIKVLGSGNEPIVIVIIMVIFVQTQGGGRNGAMETVPKFVEVILIRRYRYI
jgi:hypothetical protein